MSTTTTPITRTTPPESATGPVRCASWCEEGDGHREQKYAADQWCRSIEGKVMTTLYPAWETCDGETAQPYGVVQVQQDRGDRPHVMLLNPDDQGMRLTPDEAREVARLLNHFAWVAEQDEQKKLAFELGREFEG